MSLFPSGWWFTILTETTTTNSVIFTHYLVKMKDWIYNNNMFGYTFFFTYIPDHKSNKKLFQLKTIKISMIFLPP